MADGTAAHRVFKVDASAVVIGFGMGGLFDFVVLHAVLQWHHMVSNRVPPNYLSALQYNVFWDGIGEMLMWLIVMGGLLLLCHAIRRHALVPTTTRLVGLLILGWGAFNLVDAVFNHHVFALHNVRDDVADKALWNLGFLVIGGIVQPAVGWLIARAARPCYERP